MTAARRLLLLLTGINLVNYMDRYVVAAILEPLGKELQLSDAQLGRLTFVFIAVYMCAAPVFGYLAERHSHAAMSSVISTGMARCDPETTQAAKKVRNRRHPRRGSSCPREDESDAGVAYAG